MTIPKSPRSKSKKSSQPSSTGARKSIQVVHSLKREDEGIFPMKKSSSFQDFMNYLMSEQPSSSQSVSLLPPSSQESSFSQDSMHSVFQNLSYIADSYEFHITDEMRDAIKKLLKNPTREQRYASDAANCPPPGERMGLGGKKSIGLHEDYSSELEDGKNYYDVPLFTEEEQKEHQVKLTSVGGEVKLMWGKDGQQIPRGEYLYVILDNEEQTLILQEDKKWEEEGEEKRYAHTCLSRGAPILYGGNIFIGDNGKICPVDPEDATDRRGLLKLTDTGHYRFPRAVVAKTDGEDDVISLTPQGVVALSYALKKFEEVIDWDTLDAHVWGMREEFEQLSCKDGGGLSSQQWAQVDEYNTHRLMQAIRKEIKDPDSSDDCFSVSTEGLPIEIQEELQASYVSVFSDERKKWLAEQGKSLLRQAFSNGKEE